jgi:photosystem II stability/assembly factor-like uncharacterized protein
MKNIFRIVSSVRLLFVVFCIINSTSVVLAQWVKTNGPNSSYVTCLAVSDSSLFAGTRGSGIFRSTDNGASWTSVNSGLNSSTDSLVKALVVSSGNGGSGATLYAGTGGGVFRSVTNGNIWNRINTALPDTSILALAVSPTNSGSGAPLFAGTMSDDWDNPIYSIYRSAGGANWTLVNNGLSNKPVSAFAFSGTNILAGTNYGIYRSTDNGTTWTVENYSPVVHFDVNAFATFSDSVVLAGGSYGGLVRSTDRGITWTDVSSSLWGTDDVLSFALSPNGKGGTNIFAGTFGGVYLSTDYGITWGSINTGLTDFVLTIATSDKYLFAGSGFYVWRRPLSGITTGMENMKANMPKGFSLQQNYPNPFTSTTTIRYKVAEPGFVSLKVFNAMGKEVTSLVNEKKPVGEFSIDWNAAGMQSGIYLCRLQSGTFSETTRLVLQK